MKLSYTTLDVFTSSRYAGNPVAIVQVPSGTSLSQAQKQAIAAEFNLSEIVFLHLPAEGVTSSERKIDIFTHQAEVPFAGHPTIGTSHYLLHTTSQDVNTVLTKAGKIAIEKYGITYPVVMDNDMKTWKAFENNYWPRKYIADHEGNLRYDHIGEGAYEETEKIIQQLLDERAQ